MELDLDVYWLYMCEFVLSGWSLENSLLEATVHIVKGPSLSANWASTVYLPFKKEDFIPLDYVK